LIDVIVTTAKYYDLSIDESETLDCLRLALPGESGTYIKVCVFGNQVNLFLIKQGILISRVNDLCVILGRSGWENDLMSKVYLIKTLYSQAGTCQKCGKTLAIYKQTDKDHKHHGEYQARCVSKRVNSDPHTQRWLTLQKVEA
jgi:hypothetical protein